MRTGTVWLFVALIGVVGCGQPVERAEVSLLKAFLSQVDDSTLKIQGGRAGEAGAVMDLGVKYRANGCDVETLELTLPPGFSRADGTVAIDSCTATGIFDGKHLDKSCDMAVRIQREGTETSYLSVSAWCR